MGIPNFLGHILKSSGRIVDLVQYTNSSNNLNNTYDDEDATTTTNTNTTTPTNKPFRIAIDISTWIHSACHVYSHMLADEKHLSNYGRATLLLYQQQQQELITHPNDNTTTTTLHDGTTTTTTAADANTTDTAVQQSSSNGEAISSTTTTKHDHHHERKKARMEYIAKVCQLVMERIMKLHSCLIASSSNNSHNPPVEILIVLDGTTPPMKRKTVSSRHAQRQMQQVERDKPVDCTGNSPALERRIKANNRTGAGSQNYHVVVNAIIASLRHAATIPFLVAPYEADAQIAYLQQQQLVDLIIVDDSDMIAYGCPTPALYKLSENVHGDYTQGILLRQCDLAAKVVVPGGGHSSGSGNSVVVDLDLLDFTPVMWACFFASVGCDYCPKLRGIGPTIACKIIRSAFFPSSLSSSYTKHQQQRDNDGIIIVNGNTTTTTTTTTSYSPLERVLAELLDNCWRKNPVMSDNDKDVYKQQFISAVFMFRHAVIYDPMTASCRSMISNKNADPELLSYPPYAALVNDPTTARDAITGPCFPSPLSTYIAEGWICPRTMKLRTISDFGGEDGASGGGGGSPVPDHVQRYLEDYLNTDHINGDNDNDDGWDNDEDDDALQTQPQWFPSVTVPQQQRPTTRSNATRKITSSTVVVDDDEANFLESQPQEHEDFHDALEDSQEEEEEEEEVDLGGLESQPAEYRCDSQEQDDGLEESQQSPQYVGLESQLLVPSDDGQHASKRMRVGPSANDDNNDEEEEEDNFETQLV